MTMSAKRIAPRIADQINAAVAERKKAGGATKDQILSDAAQAVLGRSGSALVRQIRDGFDSLDEYAAVCAYFGLDPVEVLAEAMRRTQDD